MSTPAAPPPDSPRRPRRRRPILLAGAGLLALVALVLIAALFFIRTERFNRYVAGEIERALVDYGLKAEVGGFDFAWGPRTVVLKNLKVRNLRTGEPIAEIDRVELVADIRDLYALRLRREIVLKTLDLSGVKVSLHVDPQGQSNLAGLKIPPPSAPRRITFDSSGLVGRINGGTFSLNDEPRTLELNLRDLKAIAEPRREDRLIKLDFSTGAGHIKVEGREEEIERMRLDAGLKESGAQIAVLELRSPAASVTASGEVKGWRAADYDLKVKAEAELAEVGGLLFPDVTLRGPADFDGQVTGKGTAVQVTGTLRADDLTVDTVRVRGARIDGLRVDPAPDAMKFAGAQVRAQSVTVGGTRLAGVGVAGLDGLYHFKDERAELTVPQAGVARVDFAEGQVSGVAGRNLKLTSRGGRFEARGGVAVAGGRLDTAQVGRTQGQFVVDNAQFTLNQFTSALLGGSAAGDLTIGFAGSATSRVRASFKELKTADLFALAAVARSPLAGTVTGQADVSWPGTNARRLTGAINAQFSGQTTETVDAIPLTGEAALRAEGGLFNVESLRLATEASTLTAAGRFALDGDSDLNFTLASTRAEELQTIVSTIEAARPAIDEYEPVLLGDFKFEGRLTGPLERPAVEGEINASGAGLHGEVLGGLSGRLFVSADEIRSEGLTLAAANGGTAKASFAVPFDPQATTGQLTAALDRVNVEALLAAAGITIQQKFVAGEVSGETRLTGLPGKPSGSASVKLINGTIAEQPAELAEASVVFDGGSARIERAEVRLPQGRLTASGGVNLETDEFTVEGKAERIDLDRLLDAAGVTAASVTGTADAQFRASGKTSDVGQLQVELTATGQQVAINGRPTGELTVKAVTSPGGRVDLTAVSGITGKPQELRASVELRQPGRPLRLESDVTDLDLGPLLTIFAPGVAASLSGKVTGAVRVAGPLVDAQGNATLEELRGGLTLTNVALQLEGRPVEIQTPVTVALNGPEITVSPTRVSGPGIELNLGGTVAFREEARLDFGLKGTVRLEQLPQFNPDVFLSGLVTLDARLTGNTDAPNLTGEVALSNLGLTATDLPVAFEGGSGRVALSGDRITLESFTTRANDGELTAGGSVTLKQLVPAEWRFTVAAKEVEVFYQGARGLLNADLALAGTPEGQILSGEVTIPQAEYAVNFDFGGALSGGGGGLGFGSFDASGGRRRSAFAPLSLNVRVVADESILIRNEQVNTVGSALVTLGGPVADPSVTGQITFEGGTIKFRGSRYELTAGRVDLLGGLGTEPNLNFAAEGDVSGYRVYIGLEGPLNDIEVSLRAEPQLSRAEVLQLITTGRTESSTIAGNQALYGGAGAAASLISEELISKPTEEFLGLSRFQLDPVIRPNSNPAARLTIGRQLTRDLQFTYSTNLSSQQDQTAIVEYTLTNRFSALAAFTQGGSTAQGTGANNDFTIEMRARRRFDRGFGRDDAGAPPAPADAGVVVRENLKRATLPQAEVEVEQVEGIKLSSRRLRELIPVIPQGFSRPLARLGERNLTNYLQENGYFFAEVAARCQPADCAGPDLKVLYDVTPGARYDLEELRVEGTDALNIGDVGRELESQKASLFGGVPFLGRLPFLGGYVRGLTSNDRLRQDRETIRRRLVDLGFRAAQVDANLAVRPEDDHLVVIFRVAEGPRSTVAEIAVRGNALIAAPELREAVKINDGDYFSLTRAREGAEQIRGHYTGRGFLEAAAELEIIDLPENRVRLAYRVSEGARSRVAEVAVTGLTKTREESLRRLLDLKDGEVLTPEKIRNTQRTLYATGAFREVNVRAEPVGGEDESLRKVTINVTEAKPFLFVYGLGYSTDRGPSGLIEVTDTNFMNRVNSASLRVRGSRVEQLAQLTYINPRPFGEKWPTTLSVYYNRNSNLAPYVRRAVIDEDLVEEQKEGYGLSRLAAFIQTERKLDTRTSLRFRYNLERAKLFNLENIPDTEVTRFERATRLGAFSAGISRDTRDSALNATRGQLVSADHQVAARIFGGNESFNKFFGVFQRYHTVNPERRLVGNSVLAFSARVGLASLFRPVDRDESGVIDEEERQLPISERFFAGGATTLRGFSFDTAGPQDILEPTNPNELPTLVPLGGDATVLLNFEFRYPLTKRLRLVPFYDLGNVFRRVGDINWANMTNTVGLGLRVDTPVGPIGVDYGFLIDPPAFVTQSGAVLRQPRGAFHIRFGQTF